LTKFLVKIIKISTINLNINDNEEIIKYNGLIQVINIFLKFKVINKLYVKVIFKNL
jgi:hypothetical protein